MIKPIQPHPVAFCHCIVPAKIEQLGAGDVVDVGLKELDFVKVLEVPVPSDLVWLARINMLHPVQFDRMDLGLLIYCLREHAVTVKRPSERKTFERIAEKMERAMQVPPSSPPPRRLASTHVPNDKQTALKLMQRDLREWKKSAPADDPVLAEYARVLQDLATRGRRRKSHPKALRNE